MTKRRVLVFLGCAVVVAAAAAIMLGDRAFAQAGQTIGGAMSGFQEVPVISTTGTGSFLGVIVTGDTAINYKLTYSGLTGTPTAAHIHLGQPGVNGGVVAFLCGGGGKPACPPSGTVTGTITDADIMAVASQGIAAMELAEVIAAIRAGVTYANVHTSPTFGGGEIRGRIRVL
jgi:hypothetical protein